jgi:hypothetical protein
MLLMSEVDEDDVIAFTNRLSIKKRKNGNLLGHSDLKTTR